MNLSEWRKLTDREIHILRFMHSRVAAARGVSPCEGHDNDQMLALKYVEPGKHERWSLLRHDRRDIELSWSEILKHLRPLIGNRPFVEVYPCDENVINTHAARWFWVLPSHPPEIDLRAIFMRVNEVSSNHFTDSEGNPAGGTTYGRGFAISWQNGPLGRGQDRLEPNGAFVEDIIVAAIDRIEFYQAGRFACQENEDALAYLKAALDACHQRTANREQRGVEGTHAE